jgi:hypothetical protein
MSGVLGYTSFDSHNLSSQLPLEVLNLFAVELLNAGEVALARRPLLF